MHNTVHNLDVTMDKGLAYEQQSCPGVSEFADESCDDEDIELKSLECLVGTTNTMKKHSSVDSAIDVTLKDQSNKRLHQSPELTNSNSIFSDYFTCIKEVEQYLNDSTQSDHKYSIDDMYVNQSDCGMYYIIIFHSL
jgi:hypothetical protein